MGGQARERERERAQGGEWQRMYGPYGPDGNVSGQVLRGAAAGYLGAWLVPPGLWVVDRSSGQRAAGGGRDRSGALAGDGGDRCWAGAQAEASCCASSGVAAWSNGCTKCSSPWPRHADRMQAGGPL